MNRKDVLELKKRFKKGECTFTQLCGSYVNSDKEIGFTFSENFLNIPDTELFKYLEISRKVLSGGVGNNLLELNFPPLETMKNDRQNFMHRLKKSALKDPILLDEFYQSILDNYDYGENYLILLFHDVYDVMVKTSDNIKLDDSEESYEYLLCAICPVAMSKPGLGYFKTEKKIKARLRDWIVEAPSLGFVYPAFIDRSSDVNALMYYTKNAKDSHPELMEKVLGCMSKQTASLQRASFQEIVESTVGLDDEAGDHLYVEIQENLNTMIEDHKDLHENTSEVAMVLSKSRVKDLLIHSGVSEAASEKIEANFQETFGEEPPLAEHLVDAKIIKANVHKKKEAALIKQVQTLEHKLEAVHTSDGPAPEEEALPSEDFDVVLHVKPSKLSKIKTEVIDGQKCILVPLDDDEQATINGREDMV